MNWYYVTTHACIRQYITADDSLSHGYTTYTLMFPYNFTYRRGIMMSCCSQIVNAKLIIDVIEKKVIEGFLLVVTNVRFFFRLQQQRSEDGVQKTRAVCKLQRTGLAGMTLVINLLHQNFIYTICGLCSVSLVF